MVQDEAIGIGQSSQHVQEPPVRITRAPSCATVLPCRVDIATRRRNGSNVVVGTSSLFGVSRSDA